RQEDGQKDVQQAVRKGWKLGGRRGTQAAGELSKRAGLAPENEARHPCRLDLMLSIWAYDEALLLGVWPTRARPHPQRSAQADADLRGVVTVESEGLSHSHGYRLAWPENHRRSLGAPPKGLVKSDFIGCKTRYIGASGCIHRGVRAVVINHHNSFFLQFPSSVAKIEVARTRLLSY